MRAATVAASIAGDAYRDCVLEPVETDEQSQATPPLT